MQPDKKDKKIIKALNQDARLSIADLSRKTGIQRDSILYRIKKMQKEKIIRFFHVAIDPTQLGYPIYSFVNLTLFNLTKESEKKLLAHLKSHPNVVYLAKTTGKWDLTLNIVGKSLIHFNEILTEIRMKFSNIIKEYETSSIVEEYKYDNMVELI